MQIIVLGMHRSGTSVLTRLLNLMGAYIGPEDSLMKPAKDNPTGFWERMDVHRLHNKFFELLGADWYKVSHFDLVALSDEQRTVLTEKAEHIVRDLDLHRPWVLKDPRLCLLFPFWRNFLQVPVCLHVYRSPLQVAQSLQTRNGFPIRFGIALWEYYNLAALTHTYGLPRLLIAHRDLMTRPVETMQTLYTELELLEVRGLHLPSEKEILAFIDAELYRERGEAELEEQFASHAQIQLFQALKDRQVLEWQTIPSLSAGARETLQEYEATEKKISAYQVAQEALQKKVTEMAQTKETVQEQLRIVEKTTLEEATQLQARVAEEQAARERWETEVARLQHNAAEAQQLASEREGQLSIARNELQIYIQDTAKLIRWIEQLDRGIESIFQSKRWKLGHNMSALFRKIRFKPPLLIPQNFCNEILTSFYAWQASASDRRKTKSLPSSPLHAQINQFETIEFQKQTKPIVSIIIPVYNQWEYTYECLKTIVEHTKSIPYEVIIADDVSTDETQELTRYVKNAVWVRNSTNLGFTLNCNNAAQHAKGEYLLFLNNDTNVQSEWLDAMLDPMRKDNNVGLVGAKLVYPDGKLQEAGGIVWNDASGRNYGRQKDPESPEYNYLKEVDYCSGACILVRASLWNALGGFDPQFAPAYYEDTDLAFRIRQLGYQVVYQPRAVVVHFEGASHGKSEKEGVKSYQVKNKEKFYEKWRYVLQRDHFEPGDSVFVARDRAFKKDIILVIDHRVLTWDKDAGSKATYQYIKLFVDNGHKVVFVGDNFRRVEPYTTALQQLGVEVLYGPWYDNEQLVKWLQENGRYIRYALLNRPHIAQKYIDAIKKWTRAQVFYYAHDLHWLRAKGEYEATKSEEALEKMTRWEKIENQIIIKSDVILVVSHFELEILRQKFPRRDIRYVPLAYYEKIPVEDGAAFSQRSGVLFVGGAGHPPNVDGVRWYLQEIHPLVQKQLPAMSLYVCGERMDEVIQTEDQQSVKLLGYVSNEELAELYRSVRVVIAPLRYGGGVKGKILEALEYGVPVVTTTVGAQGLPEAEHILLTADTPAEFVKVLQGIYNDEALWMKQANAGLQYMREHFSPEVMRVAFADIFGQKDPAPAAMQTDQIRSYAEYQVYTTKKSQERSRQAEYEKKLIQPGETFHVSAYCYACQRPLPLRVDFRHSQTVNGSRLPNWRERLVCPKCGLNNRRRASIHLFEELLRPTKDSRLYITEQGGTLYPWLARKHPHTIGSEYLGDDVKLGEKNAKGIRNEDLTKLSFAEDQFDYILSFDVFEHIPNVQQALQECFRVLKLHGSLFFSVPFVTTAEKNIVRATLGSSGEITHLLPAEYHGDPVRPDGVLAFYHFGWELLEQLREIGFADAHACFYWSDHFGYLGKEQLVLIARKGAAAEKPKSVIVRESPAHNGLASSPSQPSVNTVSAPSALDNVASIVCLLGMGRSGTSLVASLCRAMGVYLGELEDMVKPNRNNPKGYWENGRFTAINHQILLDMELEYFDFRKGQAIDSQELIRKLLLIAEEETWTKFVARNPMLFQQAVDVIIKNFGDRPLWGWKDPRSSLTLEFWKRAIAEAYTTIGRPYQIKYILCNRNLSEVTGSLSLDGEVVRTLWSYSTSAVLRAIAKEPFMVIDYGELIGSEMEESLGRLYRFLYDKKIPANVLEEGKAVIDPDLYRVRSREPMQVVEAPQVRSRMRHIVIHYHIFKNAGSTVDSILSKNFGDSWGTVEGSAVWDTLDAEDILRYARENPAIKAISSHHARLPEPAVSDIVFYPLVFLRHPIDRVGSVYAFQRRQARNNLDHGVKVAQENDIAGYVKWRLTKQGAVIKNFQTAHLSGREKDMRRVTVTLSDLHLALERIHHLNFFGIVELFTESISRMEDYLSRAFGRLDTSFRVKNKSQERKATLEERLEEIEAALGPNLYNELLDKNALDLELYDKAVSLFRSLSPLKTSPKPNTIIDNRSPRGK